MSKTQYDWEAIKRDWRTGQHSNRELSEIHGPTHSMIARKARSEKWEKDIVEDYQKELKNQSIKDSAQGEYTPCTYKNTDERLKDEDTIKLAVEKAVHVVRDHKKMVKGLREFYDKIYRRAFKALDEEPDSDGILPSLKGFKSYHESVFDILSKLSKTSSDIVKLERQAFNMDAKENKDGNNNADLDSRIKTRMDKLKNGSN